MKHFHNKLIPGVLLVWSGIAAITMSATQPANAASTIGPGIALAVVGTVFILLFIWRNDDEKD